MQTTFNDLVDDVRNLSLTEKIEIKNILEKAIIEEERNKIYNSYAECQEEYKNNSFVFSDDVNTLRKMID
ncbi:MAG: hypothetical protein V1874_00740 [Spirochaetota bacterium]